MYIDIYNINNNIYTLYIIIIHIILLINNINY